MGHRATPSCSSEAKRRRKAAWVLQLHLALRPHSSSWASQESDGASERTLPGS